MKTAMKSLPWNLWIRQTGAVARLELTRNFFQRRAWWIYFLAAGPVFLTFMHSFLAARGSWPCTLPVDMMAYASIFQVFYLRLGIFFGCVGIFCLDHVDHVWRKVKKIHATKILRDGPAYNSYGPFPLSCFVDHTVCLKLEK